MNNSNVIDEEDSAIEDDESDNETKDRPSIKISDLLEDDLSHLKVNLTECIDYIAVPE